MFATRWRMKTFVMTPYGDLRVSARRSPFVDDVVVSVAGPIRNPAGDPVPFDSYYRFDASSGWIRVWPSGHVREAPVEGVSATRSEIEGLIDRWLRDNHVEVKAVILHSLELSVAREQRSLQRGLEAARAKVADSEQFLVRMRGRLQPPLLPN
jgi:hypothetical protein